MKQKLIIIVSFLLVLTACDEVNNSNEIKVYKSNGSTQCDNNAISLDTMSAELASAGITVICAQKGHDGLFRTAVCGAKTGYINIYTINDDKLSDAQSINFLPVSNLADYTDSTCK